MRTNNGRALVTRIRGVLLAVPDLRTRIGRGPEGFENEVITVACETETILWSDLFVMAESVQERFLSSKLSKLNVRHSLS